MGAKKGRGNRAYIVDDRIRISNNIHRPNEAKINSMRVNIYTHICSMYVYICQHVVSTSYLLL